MSTMPARVLLGLVIAGIWLAVLPAVASADDCATRASRIAAGQVPSNQADPDCNKAGVIGTTVVVATASTAVGVAAVQLGLRGARGAAQPPGAQPGQGQGGAGGPVVTGAYSGPEAIDILVKSGLAKPVTDASGKPVWETDPRTGQPLRYPNGDPVPKVKPVAGFDNLGGNSVSRTVGQSINEQTGKTELVQTQTITGVTGFAGHTRPDGTIDPNVAITVNQSRAPKDGFPWVPPVEPPAPATPPAQTTTPQTPQTPPPQAPPTLPPQVTQPLPPQTPPPQTTPPQTPPQSPKPPQTPQQTTPDQIPVNEKGDRMPRNPDQAQASLTKPGTTLIDPKMPLTDPKTGETGPCINADGDIVKLPGGAKVPDFATFTLDTSGGRLQVTATPFVGPKMTLVLTARDGQLVAEGHSVVAGIANGLLKDANKQFNVDNHLNVVSVSVDPKTGMIKVVTAKRP